MIRKCDAFAARDATGERNGISARQHDQAQSLMPSEATYVVPEVARLQAAAAAAAQYQSSFVYPALHGRELIGYTIQNYGFKFL